MPKSEKFQSLPAPWDRIFSLGTRIFVWGLFIGILYILQPFFLLIFLTFVFSHIQAHGVHGLAHRIKSRTARVILVFVVFLGALAATGYFITPRVKTQTQTFISNWDTYTSQVDNAIYDLMDEVQPLRHLLEEKVEPKKDGPDSEGTGPGTGPGTEPKSQEPRKPILEEIIKNSFGGGEKGSDALLSDVTTTLFGLGGTILSYGSAFLLSLLFSFLIVLDLRKLTQGVEGLAGTKVGFIYSEVAHTIRDFAKVLGRALEAQLIIAIINTVLTGIGIYFMGLPNLVFLCTIVFFCSFIPVAGVFLSSVPICLVALQEDGAKMMFIAIGLILLIHFIEAYFLNPKVFGHHLRMNAVVVLIVLTIAGKLFGVWGLILGLPMVNYIFGHAIRFPKPPAEPPAQATAELATNKPASLKGEAQKSAT